MNQADRLLHYRRLVDEALENYLAVPGDPAGTLHRAMRYGTLGGGKRLRPALCMGSCEASGGDVHQAVPAAAAVEMVHCYSLIHDDLPAMDDDDLRRGQPTVHRVFGEGMAVLAGDGLLTLAFEIMSRDRRGLPDGTVLEQVNTLARAAGPLGMVAGQELDLLASSEERDLCYLETMHRRKTGMLIWASIRTGALAGGADESTMTALLSFARELGLLYQITDDLLDIHGHTEVMGKPQGSDVRMGKLTYPSLVGEKESERILSETEARAREALAGLARAEFLFYILDRVVRRDS